MLLLPPNQNTKNTTARCVLLQSTIIFNRNIKLNRLIHIKIDTYTNVITAQVGTYGVTQINGAHNSFQLIFNFQLVNNHLIKSFQIN